MNCVIEIITEKYKFKAKLNNSDISEKLCGILPVKSIINRWGAEIYFSIPLYSKIENGQDVLEIGDIAYWPPGNCLCIFFGRTPASIGDEPRAADKVMVIGKLENFDTDLLNTIKNGEKIEIRKPDL